MQYLFGKPLADELLAHLQERIALLQIRPGLAVLLVGEDPASHLYVELKERAARTTGLFFERHLFAATTPPEQVTERIQELNARPDIHGIIVQLPLPSGFDEDALIAAIQSNKDADGFHPETLQRYEAGDEQARPVFPRAIARLIRAAGTPLHGRRALAIVNSEIFARVMRVTFEQLGLDGESLLYTEWAQQRDRLREAAVVVTSCGVPGFLMGDALSPGAVVIDGGVTRVGASVRGDVDETSVSAIPGWLSPVPGGVGPLTVASLLERTVELAEAAKQNSVY